MDRVKRPRRNDNRGRHLTALAHGGTAAARLKMFLRRCVEQHTFEIIERVASVTKGTTSKALNGTQLPTASVTYALARFGGQRAGHRARQLWHLAALEQLDLEPADLWWPNPTNAEELSTLLRGYMITTALNDNTAWSTRPIDVAVQSRNRGTRPLSYSTVIRMLSGKVLPTVQTLETLVTIIGVEKVAAAQLLSVHARLVEQASAAGAAA